jgi:hypothetical protein
MKKCASRDTFLRSEKRTSTLGKGMNKRLYGTPYRGKLMDPYGSTTVRHRFFLFILGPILYVTVLSGELRMNLLTLTKEERRK